MKQQWLKLAARIEALSLRERLMACGAAAAMIVFLLYTMMIEPALAREKSLKAVISQQRQQMAANDMELAQRQAVAQIDPDQGSKNRLAKLKTENESMRTALRTMQKGLVAPEKIGHMLEQMLQGGKLKLVSLKTLPPRGMSDGRFAEPEGGAAPVLNDTQRVANNLLQPAAPAAPANAAAAAGAAAAPVPAKQEELLYRHGVQLVLQGSYLDMVNYMEALEHMPSQLFWGKATLEAEDYPKARLTLTLYTLSLDTKWIAL
jgi:MSHA biogenesis protein MshJ